MKCGVGFEKEIELARHEIQLHPKPKKMKVIEETKETKVIKKSKKIEVMEETKFENDVDMDDSCFERSLSPEKIFKPIIDTPQNENENEKEEEKEKDKNTGDTFKIKFKGKENFELPYSDFSSWTPDELNNIIQSFEDPYEYFEEENQKDPEVEQQNEKSKTTKLFPNIETFLWYLLYQQESSNRIFENKINLVLLLIHDKRLDTSKFPKNTRILKKIDSELEAINPAKTYDIVADRQIPKISKKKKSSSQVTKDDLTNDLIKTKIKITCNTISSKLKQFMMDPILSQTILSPSDTQPRKKNEFVDSLFAKEPDKVFSFFFSFFFFFFFLKIDTANFFLNNSFQSLDLLDLTQYLMMFYFRLQLTMWLSWAEFKNFLIRFSIFLLFKKKYFFLLI